MQKINTKYHLFLGSQSPRRKEFFDYLGIPYLQISADVLEESKNTDPVDYVKEIALLKAMAIKKSLEQSYTALNPFLVTSDTTVCVDGVILAKPQDREEARTYLKLLENKTHQVYTAVYCCFGEKFKESISFVERTDVSFSEWDKFLLERYLDSGDSLDKAGGYGAQGMAQVIIKKINGSYSNVIGFPLEKFVSSLQNYFSFVESIEEIFVKDKSWPESY